MHTLFQSILSFFGGLDYASILFLMALESSIFPVPSEAVMIPAGYLVATGKLDLSLVILTGTLGSLIGALVNYFVLGKLIGKPFLLRYGKYILIHEKDYHRTEKLFLSNDKLYTFLGRLIPVVRHLISIPAGIFRMHLGHFVWITAAGAGLWCAILTLFGYYMGETIVDTVEKYTKPVGYLMFALLVFVVWFKVFRKKK